MHVALICYKNIFPNKTNNRLLAYYHYLENCGHKPHFVFIKGKGDHSGYRVKTFNSKLSPIPYFGILSSLTRCFLYHLFNGRKRVIYLYDPNLFWWPLLFLFRLQGRRIIVERTELHQVDQVTGFKAKLLRWLYSFDEKRDLWPSVLITEKLMTHYHEQCSKNTVESIKCPKKLMIPAFFEEQFFNTQPDLTEPKYVIGYFGTFGLKDNITGILKAVQGATNILNQISFRYIGAVTPGIKRYTESTFQVQMNHITQVDYSSLKDELQKCDLLISNRDSSEYSQYGFPTKLIEYLASGIPVIATDSSEINQHFKHEEHLFIVAPDSHQDLQDAILERYDKFDEFNEMGLRGRGEVLEKFQFQSFQKSWGDFVLGDKT